MKTRKEMLKSSSGISGSGLSNFLRTLFILQKGQNRLSVFLIIVSITTAAAIDVWAATPSITSILPNAGSTTTPQKVTIKGTNFASGAKVSLLNGGSFVAGFHETPDAALGVYISGNYAYVADSFSGLQVIDVSNPELPVLVGSHDTAGIAMDVKVVGNFAYVADDEAGLLVLDISNPAVPAPAGACDTPGIALSLQVEGSYAYVADGLAGIQVIDISDPTHPVVAGAYDIQSYASGIFISGNYAYVTDYYYGLVVLDISNPVAPSFVGFHALDYGPGGVHVSSNYAYMADGFSGLQVIDVSNPAHPVRVGNYDTPGRALSVYISGDTAYVSEETALVILDISNPVQPVLVGLLEPPFERPFSVLRAHVVGNYAYIAGGMGGLQVIKINTSGPPSQIYDYSTPGNPQKVKVSGNYAYVADSAAGLSVVDITNPTAPFLVGSYNTPGNALGVHISGNYAYVADDASGLLVVNIANPAAPFLVGSFDTPGNALGVHVTGNYAYVADFGTGLLVVNIANPAAPFLVGSFDTPGYARAVHVLGNYAYVADTNGGLIVLNISNPSAPVPVGFYYRSGWVMDVNVSGKYAYLASYGAGLVILDISNPAEPTLAGSYFTPGYYAHAIHVLGNYAYVAASRAGILVLDISNPAFPFRADHYDTPVNAIGVHASGNYVYVADYGGLRIIKTNNYVTEVIIVDTTTITAVFPAGLQKGFYHVLITNPGREEGILHNGYWVVDPQSMVPDLAVPSFTAQPIAAPGAAFSVNDTTTNHGAGPANPSTTAFYVSTDQLLDSGDVLVGRRDIPMLAAGEKSTGATLITIPSSLAAGDYYLIAKADEANTMVEESETDNISVLPIRINNECHDSQPCGVNGFCKKMTGDCGGMGICQPRPTSCVLTVDPACGCNGITYPNSCEAELRGMNIAAAGMCNASSGFSYYFPSIKDNDPIGWANYLTVAARDPVPMDVSIRVFDMDGVLKETYMYSNTAMGANAPAIPPYARVAQRPCLIASGSSTVCSVPVEGSMIVETSVPAVATTNTIANYFEGFSIVESAKPRSVHNFPKAFDGSNNYQVYVLVQNIHATARNVTTTLYGKNATSPGHGAKKTYTIPAYGTLKFRPSDVAGGVDFNGSVVVSSDGTAPGDGLGPAIPAMCRFELGKEAMTIYESTVAQPALYFPTVRDGKFGGTMDYQNYLSVVNPGATDTTVEVILYTNAGVKKATTGPVVMQANGKATWRPAMILGTITAPVDFEGSVLVTSTAPVVGQTNTMYPGANIYQCDAFDIFESALPAPALFFPKAFDNIAADGHLYDNVVYVQNPDAVAKNITIEQFNNNGSANGVRTVPLGPNATYVYRPKDIVMDGTGQFRGSVRVTETSGGRITGAIKYDLHQGATSTTPVDAMTLYRSMGM